MSPVSRTSGKLSFRFTVDLCGFLTLTVILDGMGMDVPNQKSEGDLVMLTGIIQMAPCHSYGTRMSFAGK